MPTLAPTEHESPSTAIGSANATIRRLATKRRVVGVGQAREDQRELVAPEARRRVALATARSQYLGRGLEHPVPRVVAVRVVDGFEAVEIACQQREAIARATRRQQRLAQPVEEERAIGEPGEAVAEREIVEPRVVAHPLRDVVDHRDDADFVAFRDGGSGELQVEDRSVLAHGAENDRDAVAGLQRRAAQAPRHARPIRLRDDIAQRQALREFVPRTAEQRGTTSIQEHERVADHADRDEIATHERVGGNALQQGSGPNGFGLTHGRRRMEGYDNSIYRPRIDELSRRDFQTATSRARTVMRPSARKQRMRRRNAVRSASRAQIRSNRRYATASATCGAAMPLLSDEVGDRPRDFEDPVIRARRQRESRHRLRQQRGARRTGRAVRLDLARTEPRVRLALARQLPRARRGDVVPHARARRRRRRCRRGRRRRSRASARRAPAPRCRDRCDR